MGTKRVDVFLMFKATDRNNLTLKGKTTIEVGPDWANLKVEMARKGYALNVAGPPSSPTVQEVSDSLANAEVTLFIGHGSGDRTKTPFVATQLKLNDGLIQSSDGMLKATWSADHGTYTPDAGAKPARLKINKVTGLFTCNSDSELPKAFDIPEGSKLITNDGGADGTTRIGTMEQAAFDFLRSYAATGGDVTKAKAAAQSTFVLKGKKYAGDKGDTIHDH